MLGIELTDPDVGNIPLLAADPYGKFIRGANGLPQLVVGLGADGKLGTADDVCVEGNPASSGRAPPGARPAPATPSSTTSRMPRCRSSAGGVLHAGRRLRPSATPTPTARRSAASTTCLRQRAARRPLHHRRRPRQREHRPDGGPPRLPLRAQPPRRAGQGRWRSSPATSPSSTSGCSSTSTCAPDRPRPARSRALSGMASACSRPRRFTTEMQYQHLVFEEFARKMQPDIDVFVFEPVGRHQPGIFAEFAHVVYRFGHSMLQRGHRRIEIDADGKPVRRHRPVRRLPQPARLRLATAIDHDDGGRRDHPRHDPPGRQRDRRVRHRRAAQPARSASRSTSRRINIARGRDIGMPSLNEARATVLRMAERRHPAQAL